MDLRNRVKHLLKMCGHAFFSTIHERLDALERQARNASFPETQAALLQASIHTVEKLHELTDHVVVDSGFNDSEVSLMEFLYSYLPTRRVVLVGVIDCRVPDWLEVSEDGDLAIAGFRGRLEGVVAEMRSRGYPWHIVLYRIPGSDRVGYYSNYAHAVPDSWGNVFFFRDYGVFAQAQDWCSAVLRRTYFKPKA